MTFFAITAVEARCAVHRHYFIGFSELSDPLTLFDNDTRKLMPERTRHGDKIMAAQIGLKVRAAGKRGPGFEKYFPFTGLRVRTFPEFYESGLDEIG
jgi:hypothetical protein